MPEQGSSVDSGAAETQPQLTAPGGEQAASLTQGQGAAPRGSAVGQPGDTEGSQHPRHGVSLGAGMDTDTPLPSALLFLAPDQHTALRGSGAAPGVTLVPPLPSTSHLHSQQH